MNYLVATEHFFGDQPGGSGRIAWELARMMRARGHRAALVCGTRHVAPTRRIDEVEGITIARYPFPRSRSWDPRRLEAHIDAAAKVVQGLGERWDVVHGHNLAPALGAFRAAHASRRIATVHSPAVLEQVHTWGAQGWSGRLKLAIGMPMLRRAEWRLYHQAASVSALSHYTIAEMTRLFGSDLGRRMVRIPWWSDIAESGPTREEARARLGWPSGPILYTLRRLVPRMGVDVLLQAVERLATSHSFALYIAGDGPERAALEAAARRSVHRDRIRFLGTISDKEADLAYRAADVFVLPTRSLECFGIIALEAMQRGLPVIGARVGAVPEVVTPILSDWMFEPGDVAGLAVRLDAFLRGASPLPGASELRAHVRERYGKERISDAYVRWIEGAGEVCAS